MGFVGSSGMREASRRIPQPRAAPQRRHETDKPGGTASPAAAQRAPTHARKAGAPRRGTPPGREGRRGGTRAGGGSNGGPGGHPSARAPVPAPAPVQTKAGAARPRADGRQTTPPRRSEAPGSFQADFWRAMTGLRHPAACWAAAGRCAGDVSPVRVSREKPRPPPVTCAPGLECRRPVIARQKGPAFPPEGPKARIPGRDAAPRARIPNQGALPDSRPTARDTNAIAKSAQSATPRPMPPLPHTQSGARPRLRGTGRLLRPCGLPGSTG